MKHFFVKYCWIWTRTINNSDGSITIIPLDEEMVWAERLCLCTDGEHIRVGDKVRTPVSDAEVIELHEEKPNVNVRHEKIYNKGNDIIKFHEGKEDTYLLIDLYKIIGQISSKAIWVIEGDEFDEDEVSIQKICHDDSCPPYDSFCFHCQRSSKCDNDEGDRVLIKNPSCQHFH